MRHGQQGRADFGFSILDWEEGRGHAGSTGRSSVKRFVALPRWGLPYDNAGMSQRRNIPGKSVLVGIGCLVAAAVLYVVSWILVYVIQSSSAPSPTMEVLGLVAYFCSVLPVGPASLVVIGFCLLVVALLREKARRP
jgi:hypothetical protein